MRSFWERRLIRHNIGDLRNRISESTDLLLFDEAIKCLEGQVYRAAYVMTWLCIAESLRNKFMEMARRDSEVGRIVGQIEEAERQKKATDRLLLGKAAQLGMITPDEEEKLEHMLDMRHIYAHPRGTGPSKEEVIAALVIAVEAVLGKPPLLRHGYVANLLESLFGRHHFLDDVPERIREYAIAVPHRVHPDVQPYLLERLAERLEQTVGDPELGIFRRRGLEFGTSFLVELRPDLSAEAWNALGIMQRYPAAGSLLFGIPEVWPRLPEQVQDMVLGHLVEPVEGGQIQPPTGIGLQRARVLSSAGLLTPRQQERLFNSVESAPYPILKEAGVPLEEYAHRVIRELATHNWYRQNPASDGLRDAGPHECIQVDETSQEQLGRNILQAADGSALHAESLILSIITKQEVWPRAFVEGLILETLVNDDGCFRLKGRHFGKAISIAATHPEADAIFDRLIEEVRACRPKDEWLVPRDHDRAMTTISNIRAQEDPMVHPYLDRLIEALNGAKSRAVQQTPDRL